MHGRHAATFIRPLGLLAAILLAAFAGFGPSTLAKDNAGNNGTVKIHEGATENDAGLVRNEPHVCTFHLHFYFADPTQGGAWEIQEWSPTGDKGTVVRNGTYDTAGDGEDRRPADGAYTLPDGHYKLFWDGDATRHDKMKVFWVECAPPGEEPSVGPSGEELPIEGSASPTGEELDIVGTPPPTDTADVVPTSSPDGWRAVVLGAAVVLTVVAFLVPSLIAGPIRTAGRHRR